MVIGVISDTHGLLRPEAMAALEGVDHILHAGDVGEISILEKLAAIAPVTAIRGNIDSAGPCAELPPTEVVELGGSYVAPGLIDAHVHIESSLCTPAHFAAAVLRLMFDDALRRAREVGAHRLIEQHFSASSAPAREFAAAVM